MTALTRALPKYAAVTRLYYRNATTYFSDTVVSSSIMLVMAVVFVSLYELTYQSVGATRIGGLTVEMTVYVLMVFQSLRMGLRIGMPRIIAYEIWSGQLAYRLNKPYSFLLFQYSSILGSTALRMVTNLALGMTVCYLLVGPIQVDPVSLVLGGLLLIPGILLWMTFQMTLGLSGFWVSDVDPIMWFFMKFQLVLGGGIIPLALFPDALRRVAEMLPFAQTFYNPARVIVEASPGLFLSTLLLQLFWLSVMVLVANLVYRLGVKRFEVNGG